MFDKIKETEREGLDRLPESVAIQVQTGYLLGYADCWNKFWNSMTKQSETKNGRHKTR